ncbi:hypothetical protein CRYUN_Cryun07bG0000400 [Craigia yunnanensis]
MAENHQQNQQHRQQQHQTDNLKNFSQENGPSRSKVLAVVTLLPVGGTLLLLAGLSLIGTLVGLTIATPIFLIFSPVLVPAALVIAGSIAGFLISGAFGIIGLSSLSWIANYLRRMRGSMSQQLDQAKRRSQDTAGYLGQRTRDVGQKIQNRNQEGGRIHEGGRDQEVGRTQEGIRSKPLT